MKTNKIFAKIINLNTNLVEEAKIRFRDALKWVVTIWIIIIGNKTRKLNAGAKSITKTPRNPVTVWCITGTSSLGKLVNPMVGNMRDFNFEPIQFNSDKVNGIEGIKEIGPRGNKIKNNLTNIFRILEGVSGTSDPGFRVIEVVNDGVKKLLNVENRLINRWYTQLKNDVGCTGIGNVSNEFVNSCALFKSISNAWIFGIIIEAKGRRSDKFNNKLRIIKAISISNFFRIAKVRKIKVGKEKIVRGETSFVSEPISETASRIIGHNMLGISNKPWISFRKNFNHSIGAVVKERITFKTTVPSGEMETLGLSISNCNSVEGLCSSNGLWWPKQFSIKNNGLEISICKACHVVEK